MAIAWRQISITIATAVLLCAASVQAKEATVLRFYNWTDYIDPAVLDDFTKETGIRVEYTTFETSEELEQKILSKTSGYDLVVTAATFLARQRAKGFFQKIDKTLLKNYAKIDRELLGKLQASDPDNSYGVPYLWGTTIFAYNKRQVTALLGKDAPLDSWKLLFNLDHAKALSACGIAMIDSPSEVLPELLRYAGQIPNSQNPLDYSAADRHLQKLRSSIRYFGGEEIIDDLANGKICIALSYSGDLSQARAKARDNNGDEIVLVNPIEGAQMWTDMMAIPVDSKDRATVHQLIDFLLRPQNMARISNMVEYANPEPSSWPMVEEAIRTDTALFPNADAQKKLYTQYLLTDAIQKIHERIWRGVKK